ncbi:Acetyl-CoA acetyltransferase OS=Streptomyces antimycoticus OX=68175 GN=SANT12839_032370 PE=3 SV=1 [Streptomyces antimycoticus]
MVANMIATGVIGHRYRRAGAWRCPGGRPLGRQRLQHGPGKPFTEAWNVDLPAQLQGAERLARHRGLTRGRSVHALGLIHRSVAARAWA